MLRSTFTWAAADDLFTAAGHERDGAPTERHIGERPNAASSLHTTAHDFARFVAAMLCPDCATWSIGSRSVHAMLRPQVNVNERVKWALGWGLESGAEGQAFWHWGDNPGYNSFAIGLVESQTGAMRDDPSRTGRDRGTSGW
jgi:CubicO group peptidase (beta-lactamase class C family)